MSDDAPETAQDDSRTATRKRGRRASHADTWRKVTVVLFDRQVVFLDRLGADMRAASGVPLTRAHIIRALVDALADSHVDLTLACSEADLRSILEGHLVRP